MSTLKENENLKGIELTVQHCFQYKRFIFLLYNFQVRKGCKLHSTKVYKPHNILSHR